jgi:hypothetical protein
MFSKVRHINPKACDRVRDLIREVTISDYSQTISAIECLHKIKPIDAKKRLDALLSKIEKQAIRGRFNFILRGLPDSAPLQETNISETIGYPHVRDTMRQFGKFTTIQLIRGTVYVNFVNKSSCTLCHSLVNNMQVGTNIVTTECPVE